MTRIARALTFATTFIGLLLLRVPVALAHDAPDEGAEWLMADWMLGAFLIFMSSALVVFVIAYKRGLLHDIEAAKYHILTIDEPDYYSPEWAEEDGHAQWK